MTVLLKRLLLGIAGAAALAACTEPPAPTSLQQTLGGEPDPGFLRATTPTAFSFPNDHGAHPGYQTEWWYFTGHLTSTANNDESQRRFGYQLTFFRQALTPQATAAKTPDWSASQLYLAHFALSDLDGGQFHHAQRLTRGAAGQASAALGQMAVQVEDWQVNWTDKRITLSAAAQGQAIALELAPISGVVVHGDRGLSIKGAGSGNASYYYSIPELASSGTLKLAGQTFTVSGDSWLDREWSTSVLGEQQAGWDWFSLNLGKGRYLMLFQLRDRAGKADAYSAGTLVDGARVINLTAAEFQLEADHYWRSPHSGARYPLRWQIRVPAQALELTVSSMLDDQEVNQTFRYWEGAINANGRWRGEALQARGYLEMTGYDTER